MLHWVKSKTDSETETEMTTPTFTRTALRLLETIRNYGRVLSDRITNQAIGIATERAHANYYTEIRVTAFDLRQAMRRSR